MPISCSPCVQRISKRGKRLLLIMLLAAVWLPLASAGAEALSLTVSRERSYVYINEREMFVSVALSGGTAPYEVEVSFAVDGETKQIIRETYDEPGAYAVRRMPRKGGDWHIHVRVRDAAGEVVEDSVQIRASVRDYSTEEGYQDGLERLNMTYDWRADLITVAQFQLGYRESTSDYIDGDSGNPKGATRYGLWMGDPYSEWCATFLAYSMMKADVPIAQQFSYADVMIWVRQAQKWDIYRQLDYQPRIGDIVFLIPKNSDTIGHIGLVEFVTENTIGTIEGNVSDAVGRRTYYTDDEKIAGYMSMEALMQRLGVSYDADPPVVYEVVDLADRYGYVNRNKVNMRAGPDSVSGRLFKNLDEGTRVTVTARITIDDDVWYQADYRGKLGYILASYLTVDASDEDISSCGCYDMQSGDPVCSMGCLCLCHGFTFTVEEDEAF